MASSLGFSAGEEPFISGRDWMAAAILNKGLYSSNFVVKYVFGE